jgi:hypothetical protein
MEKNISTYKIELIVNHYLDPAPEGKSLRKVNQIERILLLDGEVVARETHKRHARGELYKLDYICSVIFGGYTLNPKPDLSFEYHSEKMMLARVSAFLKKLVRLGKKSEKNSVRPCI